jgi:hypothetical protein
MVVAFHPEVSIAAPESRSHDGVRVIRCLGVGPMMNLTEPPVVIEPEMNARQDLQDLHD